MNHYATSDFWRCYKSLPNEIQQLADKNFKLLQEDPRHPSLHFKKIGNYWSARVGLNHRALAKDRSEGVVWFWIGPHDRYEQLLKGE